jgi:hypothetical protein
VLAASAHPELCLKHVNERRRLQGQQWKGAGGLQRHSAYEVPVLVEESPTARRELKRWSVAY